MNLFGKFSLLFLFLILGGLVEQTIARNFSQVNRVDQANLTNSTVIRVLDRDYGSPGVGTDYVTQYTAVPALVYNRGQRTDLEGNVWSYEVEYDLVYTTASLGFPGGGTPITYTKSGVLFIEHNNTTGIYEALGIHENVTGNVELRVRSITSTGNVPSDIHLELQLQWDRYDYLDASVPITGNTLAVNYLQQRTEVAWPYRKGAEYYELEWVFWDYENEQFNNLPTMDQELIFERAVRIETTDEHYTIDHFYPNGVVYFRVRPVGRYIRNTGGDYSHLKYGTWESGVGANAAIRGIADNAFDVIGHDKIWQMQRSFAEDAKSKQVIQYFDKSLRGRQTLTNLSSDELTIAAETVYDAEGRASLSVIPVPTKSLLGRNPLEFGGSTLTQGEGGLISTGAIDYTYQDFDKTGHAAPLAQTDANGKKHVASVYYSADNPFTNHIHRDYIPDAGDYPITQVRFLNDGTGRVARQSGIGDFYQLGTNHETKYYYSNPTHTELRRLFGQSVGDERHYRKNYVVDANGQISTTYIDQAGQTIATGLAGASPDNLQALDGQNDGAVTITSSLMGKNVVDPNTQTSILSHSIFCDVAPRTDQFTYTLTGSTINDLTASPPLCIGCHYTIDISLMDEDNNSVPITLTAPATGGATIYNGVNIQVVNGAIQVDYNSSFDNDCSSLTAVQLEFEATLPNVGSYKLLKVVRVVQPEPDGLLTYLSNNNQLVDEQNFIDQYILNNIDPNLCDYCNSDIRTDLATQLAAAEYPNDTEPGSTYYQAYLDRIQYYINNTTTYPNCDDLRAILALETGLETECEGKLERMKHQIMPQTDPTAQCLGRGFRLHVFSEASQGTGNVTLYPYYNSAVGTPLVFYTGIDFDGHLNNPANWQDHYADQFVQYHPEYCIYEEFCLGDDMLASRRFDFELAKLKTWTEATAFGNALQTPATIATENYQHIIAIDPFFVAHSSYASQLQTALANYCTNNNNGVSGCSCSNVFCYINDLIGAPGGPMSPLTMEDKWTIFRGIYAREKAKVVQNYLDNFTSSVNCTGAPHTGTHNCDPIFSADATGQWLADQGSNDPPNATDLTNLQNNLQNDNCSTICEGNAQNWINQLCPNLDQSSSDYTTLKSHLVNFCLGECDSTSDNPMGYIFLDHLNASPMNVDLQNAQTLLVTLNNSNSASCGYDLTTNPPPNNTLVFNLRTDVYDCTPLSGPGGRHPGFLCGLKSPQLTINYDSVRTQCLEQQRAELRGQAQRAYAIYLNNKLNDLMDGKPCMAFNETMKTTYNTTEHHYTLYYYDQAGNLIQTLPPEAVEPLDNSHFSAQGFWTGADPSHDYEMATTYQYNTLGQIVEQESPDGGITEFWYDYAQRLRLSRNARQAVDGQYAYTKFDAQGRSIEVGRLDGHGIPTDWEINRTTFPESNLSLHERIITEYEGASFSPIPQDNLRGRVARTYNDEIATYYDYDVHGNVRKIHHQVVGLGAAEIEYEYDLITSNVKQVAFMKGTKDQYFHRYAYDADNRLIHAQTSTTGYHWEEDARYVYYAHGPLARIELGADQVQGLDYFYNLQGWIKGVNNTTRDTDMGRDGMGTPSSPYSPNQWFGQDEMSFYLGYHSQDYQPIGTGVNLGAYASAATSAFDGDILGSGASKGLYNGNIAFMVTHLPKLFQVNTSTNATQATVYQYDALHRIKQMKSYGYTGGSWSNSGLNGAYGTSYTYDGNGNLQNLTRATLNGSSSSTIDNLSYSYGTGQYKNRLTAITDAAGTTAGLNDVGNSAYTYDAIGNIIGDGTNTMTWNLQNKVGTVDNHNYRISYGYDVSGNRLRKTLRPQAPNTPTSTTYYIRDASGNLMGTYEVEVDVDDNHTKRLKETPLYGSSRLGIHQHNRSLVAFTAPTGAASTLNAPLALLNSSDRTGQSTRGAKFYELSNHLGNVLATVSDMKLGYVINVGQTTAQGYKAQVQTASDYFPFGWQMTGRQFSTDNYRFGFNGKEKNPEINEANQDFGARFYDGRIGRWWSVDPLAQNYPSYTPYCFAGNSPILYIDPDGQVIRIHYKDEKGRNKYYDYTPGIKPTTNNRFVQRVHEAISYVLPHDKSRTFDAIHSSKNVVNIYEAEYQILKTRDAYKNVDIAEINGGKSAYNPETGEMIRMEVDIKWDPDVGLLTTEGGGIAPSTILLHEADHGNRMISLLTYNELKDFQESSTNDPVYGNYDNAEEKRVITNVERAYIFSVNQSVMREKMFTGEAFEQQGVRADHRGELYYTENVNSIKPLGVNKTFSGRAVQGTSLIIDPIFWFNNSKETEQSATPQN